MQKSYPDFEKCSGYILCRDFHLHQISCQKSSLGYVTPLHIALQKTLESAESPPFSADNRKVFTVKVKANIANFSLCDEFNGTISDPAMKHSLELTF